MSDEVPVSEVLCEAAEYLCKLGANLKVRSENLRARRITRDKLKNTHAVQKAADKLLLICELSKKSLCNVEVGVQKILNVCIGRGNKQTSTTELSRTPDTKNAKDSKSHHILYRSSKLRIKQKVNFKHYASAKVSITSMPLSLHDKYPVYHDCKLYRIRMRKANQAEREYKKSSTLRIQDSIKDIATDQDSTKDVEANLKNISNNEKPKQELDAIQRKEDESASESSLKDKNQSSKTSPSNFAALESPSSKSVKENNSNEKITSDNDEAKESKHQKKKSKNSSKKFKHLIIHDDSSDNEIETENKKIDIAKSSQETHEPKVLTDRHDADTKSQNQIIEKHSANSSVVDVPAQNKDMLAPNETEEKDIVVPTDKTDEEKDLVLAPDKTDEEQTKPFIKCIDITKLLKSDVDSNSDKISEKSSSKKGNPTSKRKHRQSKEIIHLSSSDDETFWREKRTEVEAFKSRNFSINMIRLNNFPDELLIQNFITKITKNGETVAELKTDEQKNCTESISNNLTSKPDVHAAKSALLNDSDSERNCTPPTLNEIDIIKNTLLEDSDSSKKSDKHETKKSDKCLNTDSQNNDETDKNVTGSNQQASEVNDGKEESAAAESKKTDELKSALLNDSSNDQPITPHRKRKRSSSSTPQSKRKHAMESMHAKKMLLTYSSSSDTDDEQLKKALKEIKKSLLEVSDDDQSPNLKETMKCRKRLIASSSSESELHGDEIKINLPSPGEEPNKNDEDENKDDKQEENEHDKQDENKDEDNPDDKLSNSSENITQVDGSMDETSCSKVKKMGRSKAKPNASSSQNSDTQDTDKDIDGLVNLKTLNKKSRRRDSTSTSKTDESTNKRSTRGLPKVPALAENVMLEEESNSSGEESPIADDIEDLPPVNVSLNGGSLGHMAKDDLLEESDSSSTAEKSSEEMKNEDESPEEDNVKSKRQRKANAISSDSDGGARKAKDSTRLSDFDDSEADTSEPAKKSKRKKKGTDSDSSAGSSDGGKKKRKRIKQVDDSEGSGSESETERKHGRKNIRRVMGKDQLEEATKKAARQEKERVARIAERQRLYNNLQFDESGKPDEVMLNKVVLDFDPESKEPIIQVDRGLVKKLKPHQANGIKFMWDACFESVKRIKKDKGSGCILAHCMGLGKTLQVVSLTHTLLTHSNLTHVKRVLVVCPLSTVLNWVNEFNMWLKNCETDHEVDVYELSRFKQNSERAYQLQSWYDGGGVCVLGYEMFRNLSADNSKKYRKKMLQTFQRSLVDPGPDMVVCDEGHLLKNEKTSLSQSMNRVKTLRRIVLTGTPLQNNLKEYYCMVQFVKPNLLGKYNEYLNRFVNPITNGQYTDSTEHDIRIMKRRSHVLHKMLDGAVQRRDYGVLAPFLPPKHEYVLFITLTDIQTTLYQFYLDNYSRRPLSGRSGFLFPDFQSLQRIWTHPLVLKYNSVRYEIMQQKKRDKEEEEDSEGSLVDFIDDESTPDETSTEESSDDQSDLSDDSTKKSKKKKSNKKSKDKDKEKEKEKAAAKRRGTRANPIDADLEVKPDSDVEEVKNENPTEWWIKLVSDDELDDLRNSHKLILLFEILRQCEAIGDKLLVFSQSLYSLDLIEHFLGKIDEATQEGRIDEKLGNHVGSWSPGIDYFRLDGSTSCENRSIWCKNFNREDNPRARLFLISTRAGGLGINLVAANRVVIFDVSWNPSHDVQSIFRVYRFGQKKPCYVYRFLAMGTMEEKIYERQVTKQAISKRVIDEQQIDRHYAENDLAELYKFEPSPSEPRPLPPLPKDRLFAEMLKEHDKQIYKYHEHDSLLENKEEETLTEEERKAAWEDFENEKNRPPPAPFPNVWPMNNGMAPGLLVQQQQQLAFAALAAMLRKDMPNINENQIRDMLPMIYNANPALMQKMSDIYKYSQPGMMNQMMNPLMGTGAAGMGGSSGLQYEPPWQRQQQQQNQMRLQQLMQQQQNSMNAKYYAGGLGSRDPVAMALQQARARQMMSAPGETAGRPRGRPPLARPHTSTDVVNLDSD